MFNALCCLRGRSAGAAGQSSFEQRIMTADAVCANQSGGYLSGWLVVQPLSR